MAHGKAATMDSCVEIKILLIKNEQKKKKKVEKTNQKEKGERELIAICQKLKSEKEPRNKNKF